MYLMIMTAFGCNNAKEVVHTNNKIQSNYIEGDVAFVEDTLAPFDFLIGLNRFNFALQKLETVRQGNILSRNNYFLEFGCSKSELLKIFLEDVFVTPGDTVTINVTFNKRIPKIEKFLATGKNSGNYNYYFSLKSLPFQEPSFENYKSDFNNFKNFLLDYRHKRLVHFSNFIKSNKVSSEFIRYVKKDIDFQYWALLSLSTKTAFLKPVK